MPMTLTKKDLEKTAKLAHLELKEDNKQAYLDKMNSILDQVKTIDALPLDNVEPLTTVLEQDQFKRADTPVKPADLLLEKNAPSWEEGAFKVPRILNR